MNACYGHGVTAKVHRQHADSVLTSGLGGETLLEVELETVADDWRKRWFVKPGLTGLAQINGVSSTDPEAKLRYDIEYIRRQSFWFDQIVTRQLWQVLKDVIATVRHR